MEKHIPYDKLSKKQQRALNAQRRVTWGTFSPITRKPAHSKTYNRAKARSWKNYRDQAFFICCFCASCRAVRSSSPDHLHSRSP